ncbi:thermonuclease family protein [Patescibacteria group bacterium]
MKKRLILPLLVFSLLLNGYFLVGGKGFLERKFGLEDKTEGEIRGRVVRVIDGDTFDLEGGVRVRLAGAGAPEYPQGCLGAQAKERLAELVSGKEIKVTAVKEDNFGRKVGFVLVGEMLVDQVLVEEGLARAASGEDPRQGATLLAAEEGAQKAKRGIWSALCSGKEGCLIKGNVRRDRGTRVYHLSDCYNYQKIVINEQEGDRWFCDEEEAEKAGFRKSEDCP